MASIVKRGKHYCVVYNYQTEKGDRKQKWESYRTKAEAEQRRHDIEYAKSKGELNIRSCTTVEELIREYIELYGKNKWALSTYTSNVGLFENYIIPTLGKMKLSDVTSRVVEQYYRSLLEMDMVPPMRFGKPMKQKNPQKVTPSLIREIHKLLSSCFKQGVRWELMEKNPCENATRPRVEKTEREIWTLEDLSLDDAFDMAKGYMKTAPKLILLYAKKNTSFILVSSGTPHCGKLVKEYASFYQGKGGGNDVSARAIFTTEENAMLFADLLEKHLR